VVAVSATGAAVSGGPRARTGTHFAKVEAELTPLGATRSSIHGGDMLTLPAEALLAACERARALGFDLLLDVFAIDWLHYPGYKGARFSVTYHLHSVAANERFWLRVHVGDGETLPTVTGIWPAASFMEREVYDLMGIAFEGHPDLRKLVTPEDLEGHPLRKDFPIGETPTLFNDGRFLDPATFRAGMVGASEGRTGWKGGARKGVVSEAPEAEGDA